MKRLFILLSAIISVNFVALAQQKHNAAYIDDPAYHKVAVQQRGEMIHIENFESAKYFPGTVRDIWIYVPKAYDASKEACLLVGLDGVSMNADSVMDNLIASGEMPITIAIFINPGRIYDGERVLRYNRSNEWDTMSERLACFIEEEIIPRAEECSTSDGKAVRVSRKAEDRAIFGASSGAIAAFTAAWFRPDLYSRVYSGVGTYIAFRGGDQYPALVRKSEPKPIRIFLQDGKYDTWSPIFGDWYEMNQLMESALDFAGYEMTYKWDRGGHSITHGTRMFPDAMRWLWRGWPAKVGGGKTLNQYVKDIINPEKEWTLLREGVAIGSRIAALGEGRVAIQSEAMLNVYDIEAGKQTSRPLKKGEKLIGADSQGNPLTNLGVSVKNACRALVGDDGKMYVSDADGNIWWIEGKEKTKVAEGQGGGDIAIYPDWRILAQGEQHGNWAKSYICTDGRLESGQQFYYLHSEGGRMCFDTAGLLYVATEAGIQICDQNGRVRVIMSLPEGKIDDMAFSGKYLYILTKSKLYVRELLHEGYVPCMKKLIPKSEGQG